MTRDAINCLLGLCALIIAELGGLAVVPGGASITTGDPGPYRGAPPELVVAAQRVGIPDAQMERLQLRWGLPAGLHQPRPGFIKAAYQGGHIFIRRTSRPMDALAYEYLHDVWAHLPPTRRAHVLVLLGQFDVANRVRLEPDLTELVDADVRNGAAPGAARFDELHSIACSRTADAHLEPKLRAYCDDVLPGRAATTKVY
jgi:hypothetical protein